MQEILLTQVAENGASGTAIQTGKCAEETKSCGLRTKDKFTQANYEPTQEICPSVCPPINRKENPPNARTVFRLFFYNDVCSIHLRFPRYFLYFSRFSLRQLGEKVADRSVCFRGPIFFDYICSSPKKIMARAVQKSLRISQASYICTCREFFLRRTLKVRHVYCIESTACCHVM